MSELINVGIDGRALQGSRAGTGRYVFELCRELDRLLPYAKFFVYSAEPVEMPVISDRWISRVEPANWAKKLKSVLWLKFRAGRLCSQDQLDVFWANASFIPRLDAKVRVVSTVHDLAYILVPKTMKTVTYWAFRLYFRRDIARAQAIVCNSAGTAHRLLNLLGVTSFGVARPSISSDFTQVNESEIRAVLKRYKIEQPYLLTVGTLEPRKNLDALLEAFSRAKASGGLQSLKLVLVGGGGWKNDKLKAMLEKFSTEEVLPLGFVEDADLPAIYSGATAFVFPTVYEGFGMPALEAAACGLPVFVTDSPELREAAGDHGLYFAADSDLTSVLMHLPSDVANWQKPERPSSSWRDGARVLARAIAGEP